MSIAEKTGLVDLKKLEQEANVMSVAGGAEHTRSCLSQRCRTNQDMYSKTIFGPCYTLHCWEILSVDYGTCMHNEY